MNAEALMWWPREVVRVRQGHEGGAPVAGSESLSRTQQSSLPREHTARRQLITGPGAESPRQPDKPAPCGPPASRAVRNQRLLFKTLVFRYGDLSRQRQPNSFGCFPSTCCVRGNIPGTARDTEPCKMQALFPSHQQAGGGQHELGWQGGPQAPAIDLCPHTCTCVQLTPQTS